MRKKITKFSVILGLILISVAVIMMYFNPIIHNETAVVNGTVTASADGKTEYSFNINGEQFSNIVGFENESYAYNGSNILIRYVKNSPQISSINKYEFIFCKEFSIIFFAIIVLALGIAIKSNDFLLKKYKTSHKKVLVSNILLLFAAMFISLFLSNVFVPKNEISYEHEERSKATITEISGRDTHYSFTDNKGNTVNNKTQYVNDFILPVGSCVEVHYDAAEPNNNYLPLGWSYYKRVNLIYFFSEFFYFVASIGILDYLVLTKIFKK